MWFLTYIAPDFSSWYPFPLLLSHTVTLYPSSNSQGLPLPRNSVLVLHFSISVPLSGLLQLQTVYPGCQ